MTRLRLRVPERANDAVLRLLAGALFLTRDAVTLVSGLTGGDKIVQLAGVVPALAERRLDSAAEPSRKDKRL
jgi:uncharacterized protein YggU (UPF0235/DUF167 family)